MSPSKAAGFDTQPASPRKTESSIVGFAHDINVFKTAYKTAISRLPCSNQHKKGSAWNQLRKCPTAISSPIVPQQAFRSIIGEAYKTYNMYFVGLNQCRDRSGFFDRNMKNLLRRVCLIAQDTEKRYAVFALHPVEYA